jgi:hypothetical protein
MWSIVVTVITTGSPPCSPLNRDDPIVTLFMYSCSPLKWGDAIVTSRRKRIDDAFPDLQSPS